MSDRKPLSAVSPERAPDADVRSTSEAILGRMQVLDSRGNRVGTVDRVLPSDEIKLARRDSPDGLHHYIPLDWVAEVDGRVRLNKCCAEIFRDRA